MLIAKKSSKLFDQVMWVTFVRSQLEERENQISDAIEKINGHTLTLARDQKDLEFL